MKIDMTKNNLIPKTLQQTYLLDYMQTVPQSDTEL